MLTKTFTHATHLRPDQTKETVNERPVIVYVVHIAVIEARIEARALLLDELRR